VEEDLQTPTTAERQRWARQVGDRELHKDLMDRLSCLRGIEGREPPVDSPSLTGWFRVAAWNLQRGRFPAEAAALLRACGADICLLSELDSGMARTMNRNVPAEVAAALGAGYAYGVEFVELGLGDHDERRATNGDNQRGLHGNAVVTTAPLSESAVVRLGQGGDWFAADSLEPRIGSRMAVMATIMIDSEAVQVVSTHLESASNAGHRAAQLESLLTAVDAREPGGPVVIGGDLNTFGATIEELGDRRHVARMRATEPTRFSWPVEHEALFDVAARHGFSWVDANVAAPTTRHAADGLPDHVPIKLDWLLTRGLEARRPTVVPAVGADGRPLSDHNVVLANMRLATASASRTGLDSEQESSPNQPVGMRNAH
jgi:endonuclease/exonuclease/phosphatase family metal-dependent hydrolase